MGAEGRRLPRPAVRVIHRSSARGQEGIVARSEWGSKIVCPSCGAKFYDLKRDPAPCPKCETPVTASPVAKPKREEPAEKPPPPSQPPAEKKPTEDDVLAADADEDEDALADDDDEDVMEDTSDLGEDDDDMSEVKEHIEVDDDKS